MNMKENTSFVHINDVGWTEKPIKNDEEKWAQKTSNRAINVWPVYYGLVSRLSLCQQKDALFLKNMGLSAKREFFEIWSFYVLIKLNGTLETWQRIKQVKQNSVCVTNYHEENVFQVFWGYSDTDWRLFQTDRTLCNCLGNQIHGLFLVLRVTPHINVIYYASTVNGLDSVSNSVSRLADGAYSWFTRFRDSDTYVPPNMIDFRSVIFIDSLLNCAKETWHSVGNFAFVLLKNSTKLMQSNGVMQCCNAKCKASKVCEKCSFLYGSLVVVSFLSVQLHLLGHNKSKFSKKCQIQDNQNERLRRFLSLNSATYRTIKS